MVQGDSPGILQMNCERRTLDPVLDLQPPGEAANQRGLSRPELPGEEKDIPGNKHPAPGFAQGLGFCGAVGLGDTDRL